MTTTTESYHSTFTNQNTTSTTTTTTIKDDDDPSLLVANVTIDELVESCCNEVLPSSSSSQLNSSSVSPTHLVRFVHSQSSLVSQIDESINTTISSHDTPIKQPPLINVTRIPSPFSTIKPKTILESTHSMHNTTNLTNITANNISVNNYNVNIHTTNVQQPTTQTVLNNNNEHSRFDEKQTTEIVSQILKNIKEVDNNHEQTTTTNYNIHIDSFNFSSSNDQQSMNQKKSRIKKEAKALTRIIVKDETNDAFLRTKKFAKNSNSQTSLDFISVPYGWQRRILSSDLVVYVSPTNAILDSFDAIRRYLELPNSCKCGLQCPLIVEKVFNFDSTIKSKSWEVTQVLDGTHCRQKSNILEMATLTNCIDSFCETEAKPAKRRKRLSNEATNGNVFVCASNVNGNSNHESVVFVNNHNNINNTPTTTIADGNSSMTWTSSQQTNVTPPSKRPRGRPRKTAVTPPTIAQLAVKPSTEPVPSSILSPPSSVSSTSQTNHLALNSTSPLTHPSNGNVRYVNENVLTPPILSSTSDTNVIARVPSLFDQVKTTTNESTFAVLSGVQNVLLSPNRESNNKRSRDESVSSLVSTTNIAGKQVKLNVNALKPDFVRSPSATQKPTLPSSTSSNQMDVISLMGTPNQTQLILPASSTVVTVPSTNTTDEYLNHKSTTNEQTNESSQPLMIDFNDPSTTNFLLSALASGASSDSNAIVNHLFQKAQTQQQQHHHQQQRTLPSSPPASAVKKKLAIISSGMKNCTETTNLLPSNASTRPSVVLHVPSNNDYHTHNNEEKKAHQQIFFINNKPYIIQQKITHEQSSQQRLILTPSDESSPVINQNSRNNSQPSTQSTLDDGGNCLLLNGAVEPKTLRTLLKGLNSSSFSGVDNLIDTIHRFEHTTPPTSLETNDHLLIKSIRSTKASPAKKTESKPAPKRRTTRKTKQEQELLQAPIQQQRIENSVVMLPPPPIVVEQQQQQQWQTDFNTFDFSTSWGSDTNLNSLLLNDDFDTAASFDDVSFGDFEPYMNGNNDISLPSLFVKPLPADVLPSVDHLLP